VCIDQRSFLRSFLIQGSFLRNFLINSELKVDDVASDDVGDYVGASDG
jgi:hypothetical protein